MEKKVQRGQEVADGRMNNDLMPLMLARARGTIIKGLDCLKITESHNKHRERKKKLNRVSIGQICFYLIAKKGQIKEENSLKCDHGIPSFQNFIKL